MLIDGLRETDNHIDASFSIVGKIEVDASVNSNPSVSSDIRIQVVDTEEYKGDYVFTPTDDAVTVNTKDLKMTDNIVIKPIPDNYGRISWNGLTLSVS